jgi:hypothetical protein
MKTKQFIGMFLLAVFSLIICRDANAKSETNTPKPETTETVAKIDQTNNASQSRVILRNELEAKLPALEAAYRTAPGDNANRRAYADLLFKLGNIWQVNDVIAPLAMPQSSNIEDLTLGAWSAYMTGAYDRAETLFLRIKNICSKGSEAEKNAMISVL